MGTKRQLLMLLFHFTTRNSSFCHNVPYPKVGHMVAIDIQIQMIVYEQFYLLYAQCGTLQTTTRMCSEVMGIQKRVSKRQLLMLPSNCCHNLPYPQSEHMRAIGIQILEFLNILTCTAHSAAHCEQQLGRVPRSWAYKNTCQNDNC